MIKLAPSILSADFSRLGEDIESIGDADYLHFDVMDGLFVPNISIGLPVLESVRKTTAMTLDVHLMITSPFRYAEKFAEAGGDIIVFHVEAESPDNIMPTIGAIHNLGKRVGLALKPATPAEALSPYVGLLDLILVMTVEPGFGGQSFMSAMLPKVTQLRGMIDGINPGCELEVDGGINPETAGLCIEAGANVLVAGSDIFKARDRNARIAELRRSGSGGHGDHSNHADHDSSHGSHIGHSDNHDTHDDHKVRSGDSV